MCSAQTPFWLASRHEGRGDQCQLFSFTFVATIPTFSSEITCYSMTMSSSYSAPPPAYAASAPKGYSAIPQAEPTDAELPPRTEGDAESDDFKYGVNVDQCDNEIKMQFLKKVGFD